MSICCASLGHCVPSCSGHDRYIQERCRLPYYVRECCVSHHTMCLHAHAPRILSLSVRRCLTPSTRCPIFLHSAIPAEALP